MITTQCAICGKNEKLKVQYKSTVKKRSVNSSTFSARRTPDKMHYRFVRCLSCGLQFSNPIFPQKEIVRLYKSSTFEYTPESNFLKITYGKHLRQVLSNKKLKNLRLLDIGCGNGFFLEHAKKMGVGHVYGIEPGRETVMKAEEEIKKNIIVDVFKKDQFKNNSLDIVSCFHTLDHIVDVNAFLKNVYNVLKKGGIAYFIVHDTGGLSVKLFGEKSPIYDIEHIYLFNQVTLSRLFIKHGFKVKYVFAVENRYPIEYWLRMAPLPSMLKSAASWLVSLLRIKSLPLSLRAGNIGIIAEK